MPDKQAMEDARRLAAELRAAAEAGGYPTEAVQGEAPLPTFLIEARSRYQEEGWAVACTVVPVETDGGRFTLVQLYACLTPLIPEAWLEEARRLVEGENERMLFGNVLLFCSRLSLKYVFTRPDGEAPDARGFLHSLGVFALQADACAGRCDALVEGAADVETLLAVRSFGD